MQDNFLFVADSFKGSLYQFDLPSKTVWRVPFQHDGDSMSFAYDPTHLKVYWTSSTEVALRRLSLAGVDDGTLSNLRESMFYANSRSNVCCVMHTHGLLILYYVDYDNDDIEHRTLLLHHLDLVNVLNMSIITRVNSQSNIPLVLVAGSRQVKY